MSFTSVLCIWYSRFKYEEYLTILRDIGNEII